MTNAPRPGNGFDKEEFVRKFVDAHGKNRFVYHVGVRDPDGYVTGKVALQQLRGTGAAFATLAGFRQATIAGTVTESASGVIHLRVLAVVSAKAGSYCLSAAAQSDPNYPNQVFRGRFTVLGGSGAAARLHASGALLGIEPKASYDPNHPGLLTLVAAATAASLGAPHGLSAACRAAAKPPGAPTKISASLAGFAFAPAHITSLPAGTAVYSSNSTISGNVGCGAGNNLYVVVSYTGPKGATFYLSYLNNSGGKGGPPPTPLKQGQNAVPLVAAPANDRYQLAQAVVTPPAGATGQTNLAGSITLARTC